MTGGSEEPESPHDEKCPHCGLWYGGKGVAMSMHTAACEGGEDSESNAGDTTPDSGSSADGTASAAESTTKEKTTGTGTNPLVESPDTESTTSESTGSTTEESSDDPPDDIECPQCGGELIDARGHNVLRTERGGQVDAPDDFYCSECGGGFNWT